MQCYLTRDDIYFLRPDGKFEYGRYTWDHIPRPVSSAKIFQSSDEAFKYVHEVLKDSKNLEDYSALSVNINIK